MKKRFALWTFCLLGCFVVSAASGKTNDKATLRAARALIGRVTPGYEKQYVLETLPADPASGEDVFEIDSRNGKPYSEAGARMGNGREAFRGNAFYDKLIDPTPYGDELERAQVMFDKYSE